MPLNIPTQHLSILLLFLGSLARSIVHSIKNDKHAILLTASAMQIQDPDIHLPLQLGFGIAATPRPAHFPSCPRHNCPNSASKAPKTSCSGARTEGLINYYGMASWDCFRVPASSPAHLSLADVVQLAIRAGGQGHGMRFVQLPVRSQSMCVSWHTHSRLCYMIRRGMQIV